MKLTRNKRRFYQQGMRAATLIRSISQTSLSPPQVIFTNIELVKYLVEKTHTKTGLSVVANVLDKVYKIGRKVADNFKQTMQITFDEYLPKWNYRAVPQTQ